MRLRRPVGLFLLANDYIVLGNAAESYLIAQVAPNQPPPEAADTLDAPPDAVPMPDGLECPVIASATNRSSGRINDLVIGVNGHIGAGKTSAANYLKSAQSQSFYVRYSEVLRLVGNKDPEQGSPPGGWLEVMAGGMQTELNARLIALIPLQLDRAVVTPRQPTDPPIFDLFPPSSGCCTLSRQEARRQRVRKLPRTGHLQSCRFTSGGTTNRNPSAKRLLFWKTIALPQRRPYRRQRTRFKTIPVGRPTVSLAVVAGMAV